MANVKGRGVRVEIGATYGTTEPITAITQADPGVATSASHALTDGMVGYFDTMVGMVNLEGRAVRVFEKDTNTFKLEGVDTTDFPAHSTGNFIPVSTWSTVARSTDYEIGGGEGEALDSTVLLDDIAQEDQGLLSAQSVTISVLSEDEQSAAMLAIRRAARSQGYLVFRITLKTGAQRIFRGQPSLPGESVQKGQLGTGSFTVKVKGEVDFLDAL